MPLDAKVFSLCDCCILNARSFGSIVLVYITHHWGRILNWTKTWSKIGLCRTAIRVRLASLLLLVKRSCRSWNAFLLCMLVCTYSLEHFKELTLDFLFLVPWTDEQRAAVLRHFQRHIALKKCPGKKDIEDFKKKEPCVNKRDWENIKYFVRHHIVMAQKRQADPYERFK